MEVLSYQNTHAFAAQLDAEDPLAKYRDEFHYPQVNGKDVIYFTGNSLGLQPKRAQKFVDDVMKDWRDLAVEGHFYAEKPWWDYHERLATGLGKVVGALPEENFGHEHPNGQPSFIDGILLQTYPRTIQNSLRGKSFSLRSVYVAKSN